MVVVVFDEVQLSNLKAKISRTPIDQSETKVADVVSAFSSSAFRALGGYIIRVCLLISFVSSLDHVCL